MKSLCFRLFVPVLLFFSSCTIEISNPLDNVYSGITETNKTGPDPIGAVDPDDWRIQVTSGNDTEPGHIPLDFEFCAFPNPTDDYISFQFAITQMSSVTILISDKPGSIVDTLLNTTCSAGFHQITCDVRGLKSRIYRAFFLAKDTTGRKYFSYGDFRRK